MVDPSATTSIASTASIPRTPSNTSPEEQALRAEAITWMHRDRGSDCRVIHELVLGRRRIDLVFVYKADIIGMEIKGPRDSLGDGRVRDQMIEFNFYLPEAWLAVDPKWAEHDQVRNTPNLLVSRDGVMVNVNAAKKWKPFRDEMCCSRLLEILWADEVMAIGRRRRLVHSQLVKKMTTDHVRKILSRMLTGHEIMTEVCAELRTRQLVGIGSDEPIRGLFP